LKALVVRKTAEMLPLAQMHRLTLRLLDPAPTAPFNPFYGRRDDRSVYQQAVSGLRLACGLVGGMIIFGLAFWSISTLPVNAPSNVRSGHFVFWSMLCFSSVMIFVTVNRWVAAVAAFYCFVCVRTLGVLTFGLVSSTSSDWASRRDLLESFVFCIVVAALTWRFAGNSPAPTTLLDRFALTFFALAQLDQMAITYHWPPLPLISGLSALLIAWSAYRWNRSGIMRKHLDGNPTTSETLPEP
jgi:hypothetical protein